MNPRANVQSHTKVSKGTGFSSEELKAWWMNVGVDISMMWQEYSPVARAKRCVFWSFRWFGAQILKDFKETVTACLQPKLQMKVSTPLRNHFTLQNRAFFLFLHFVGEKYSVFLRPRSSWISPNARLFASAKRRDTQKSKLGENIISISWCCQWCHLIILHPHVDKPIDFNVWHSFALLVWFHSGNRSATPSTRRLGRRWKHAATFATYCLAKLTKLNQNLWHFLLLFGHR